MAETEPTELTFGADGMFAADLSDGLAAAMASIGTGIGLAIWFGWPIVCKVPRFCCHCCQRSSPATANPDDLDSVRFPATAEKRYVQATGPLRENQSERRESLKNRRPIILRGGLKRFRRFSRQIEQAPELVAPA